MQINLYFYFSIRATLQRPLLLCVSKLKQIKFTEQLPLLPCKPPSRWALPLIVCNVIVPQNRLSDHFVCTKILVSLKWPCLSNA